MGLALFLHVPGRGEGEEDFLKLLEVSRVMTRMRFSWGR